KSGGDCSTSTDVGEPALQIPLLDLRGRIETAEKLGAEARQAGLVSQTKQFVRDLCLFSFESTILSNHSFFEN
ncbi:hypothetical protein M3610_27635, partial [Neobacillus sp. MER 74]|uniref:hypothetical protein n=1 Tax=Neobacillus sp. MER 74 TaxID=2939566 RepID=UPI00203DB143